MTPGTTQPLEESRYSVRLGWDDVLVIDTWHHLGQRDLEKFKTATQILIELAVENRVKLIQIGPEVNIWPDRKRPDEDKT